MDDRISELPDEILSYILTMLSIKDLLKTSVLSKRWCKLWGRRKDLYFDIYNVLGSEKELLETGYLIDKRHVNLDLTPKEFVKRVDQFVKNFPGTTIDSFSVNFFLDCEQSNTIDQWISFAIARGVQRINLLFRGNPYGRYRANHDYKFDFALFSETNASTIEHLLLENCLVCHPTNCDFTPFKHLRSLSLSRVIADEIFIESLLSNCRLLEELCLEDCLFKSSVPKIVSSSLHHLKVSGCHKPYYKNITRPISLMLVDCLKLTSLECLWSNVSTLNVYAHVLKRINFTVSMKDFLDAFALFATFSDLESMRLEIFLTTSIMVTTSLKIAQPLKHLKQLDCAIELYLLEGQDCDLMVILNIILQTSPLLQKLSVTMIKPNKLYEEQKDIRDVEVFSHDELKVIEFGGYVGNWFETEFVMNVLKYAHKLEQVIVRPYDYSLDGKPDSARFHGGRERMIEKLQGEEVVGREKLVFI